MREAIRSNKWSERRMKSKEHSMIVNRFLIGSRIVVASLLFLLTVGISAEDDKEKAEKEKTEIRQMAQETLARLYKA